MFEKRSYVYILFSQRNGTLYVGVTNDLIKRIYQHKEKQADSFTKRYKIDKLGYFEEFGDITLAIQREKALKKYLRKEKLARIEKENPEWHDLYPTLLG